MHVMHLGCIHSDIRKVLVATTSIRRLIGLCERNEPRIEPLKNSNNVAEADQIVLINVIETYRNRRGGRENISVILRF